MAGKGRVYGVRGGYLDRNDGMELDDGSCMLCLGLATGIPTVWVRRHGWHGSCLTLFVLVLQLCLYAAEREQKNTSEKRA